MRDLPRRAYHEQFLSEHQRRREIIRRRAKQRGSRQLELIRRGAETVNCTPCPGQFDFGSPIFFDRCFLLLPIIRQPFYHAADK